jgi:hypothetical protein
VVFDFSGTCFSGCSGTATGVLTLTDAYVFGTDMTASDFERPASASVKAAWSRSVNCRPARGDLGRLIGLFGPTSQPGEVSALGDRFHEFDPPCALIGLISDP